MYKPKKHQRLEPLSGLPSPADLRNLRSEGERARGCCFELPFFAEKANENYSLTVQCSFGAGTEPVWTLYEGTGSKSRVMWSTPFVDLELLMDVVTLSIPKSVESVEMPAHLAPQTEKEEEEEPEKEEPAAAQPVPHGYYPYPPALPPGTPPGYVPGPYPPPGYPVYPTPYPGYSYPPYPMPTDANGQPVYPPPGYPVYPTPYPGYSYPPMPDPASPAAAPLPTAGTLPVQTGPPPASQSELTPPQEVQPDNLFNKKPNILLGHFLVEAGLVPEPTLDAALRVQELVKTGAFTNSQAAEAVRRAHQRGGLDPAVENQKPNKKNADLKLIGPPLGQILVEAGLITVSVLKESLRLQDLIRTGKMSQEDACKTLSDEHVAVEAREDKADEDSPRINRVIRLLVNTGILSNQDLVAARNTRHKNGGKISKILLSSNKIDQKIFEAAEECEVFFTEEKIDLEQATKALKECQKRKVKFRYVADEMKLSK
jgi:hypothetical protein